MEAQTQFSTSWYANMSLTFDEPIWNVHHCNLHTTSQAYTKNLQTWKVLELSIKARKQGYNRGFDPSLRKRVIWLRLSRKYPVGLRGTTALTDIGQNFNQAVKNSLVGGKSKPTPKVG